MTLAGWSFACSTAELPEQLDGVAWRPIDGPMTVAAALRSHGLWNFSQRRSFDDETWWYRFTAKGGGTLRLRGLATLADVFVDREHVLRSENMFHEHRVELGDGEHDILLRFGALTPALAVKRPRPRWKTRLAAHQQLRWIRTSLAGRMPGWSPPVAPVGPWRPITLEKKRELDVQLSVEGSTVRATVSRPATLFVGEESTRIESAGELVVREPKLWWPHTHGEPHRYPVRVRSDEGTIELGHVGLRTVRLDTDKKRFTLFVNDVPIFCRGASWTTTDIATLTGTPESYGRVLGLVRDAGMNMLRLSGTLFYEEDAFYEACDELGILVWQDFMFANMDYPAHDEAFEASVTIEATQLLARLAARPCLAVLCGGSEVEQQAAMFGAPREVWRGPLFDRILPEICAAKAKATPYVPSSPYGGALPFHVDEGAAHYYGVGAYLRPFDDARRARVKFASECLAFANVPEDDLLRLFLADGEAPVVHPKWKERTSKDHGSAWDFEDVRDHYLARLFGVDPARVRYEDVERYLTLSRVTSGEVMARVLAEFRRADSTCKGALVWFLQDLWPGAGWGILDARGFPKAPYWFLKRSLQPVGLFITDEGVNGLHLHLVNDRPNELAARLSFTLYRDGEIRTATGSTDLRLAPRDAIEIAADALLETFVDSAHAYRFGPPGHDLAVAELTSDGVLVARATWLRDFGSPPACSGIEASLSNGDGLVATIRTRRFAHAVTLRVPGYLPDDAYFDLPPGATRTIRFRGAAKGTPTGELSALNLRVPVRVLMEER